MVEMGNLDIYLGGYCSLLFIMTFIGNSLEKIIDSVSIVIRVVGLMTEYF